MLLHFRRLIGVVSHDVACVAGCIVVFGACDSAQTPDVPVTQGVDPDVSASETLNTSTSPVTSGVSEVSGPPNVSPNVSPVGQPTSPNPGPPASSLMPTEPSPSATELPGMSSSPSTNTGPAVPGALGPFVCPPPPHAVPAWESATAERVAGVPPADEFAQPSDTVILEGPVWWDGSLYLSQINAGTPTFGRPGNIPVPTADAGADSGDDTGTAGPQRPPPSRVLRLGAEGEVSVVIDDAGTNGLALDSEGRLLGANHKTGAVAVMPLGGQAAQDLASTYDGIRFNSPNDLTVGNDGTVYFTDPDYQAPLPAPQAETRAYRIAPGSNTAIPIVEGRRQPNGITLSPNGDILYISASDGLVAYPVMPDGSIGPGEPFAQGVVRSSDGMAVDCAGNLYTTSGQSVIIVDVAGAEVGRIAVPGVQSVTNVAFGGPDHKTVYITTLGAGSSVGLFRYDGQLAGLPY